MIRQGYVDTPGEQSLAILADKAPIIFLVEVESLMGCNPPISNFKHIPLLDPPRGTAGRGLRHRFVEPAPASA